MSANAWKNVGVLRGVAICMVVLNHSVKATASLSTVGSQSAAAPFLSIETSLIVGLQILTPFCVPAFVFSSAFFAHRFVRTWSQGWKLARGVARTYMIWAVPGFVLFALLGREVAPGGLLRAFLMGGPFASYWYLPLMVQLFLISPLLSSLVERKEWLAWLVAGAVKALSWYVFYFDYFNSSGLEAWAAWFRPLDFLPIFIGGMLASKHVELLVLWLNRNHHWVILAALTAFAANALEYFSLAQLGEWSPRALTRALASERVTPLLMALLVIGAVLGIETKSRRIEEWFSRLGLASMALLLTLDAFLSLLLSLLWHLPGARDALFPTAPAIWVQRAWLGALPVFFAGGLLGPLLVFSLSRRWLGARAKYLF